MHVNGYYRLKPLGRPERRILMPNSRWLMTSQANAREAGRMSDDDLIDFVGDTIRSAYRP